MSRENSPLICAYKFEWIPRAHIYMNFEIFDGVSPTSGNQGIQDTRYIYDMNFSLVSTTSQPQDEHK